MPEPDLTAELTAAEDIVMGRAETVVTDLYDLESELATEREIVSRMRQLMLWEAAPGEH